MTLDKTAQSRYGASLHYVQDTSYGVVAADSSALTKLRLRGNEIANFQSNNFRDDQQQNRGLAIKDIGDHFKTSNGMIQEYSIPEFTPSGFELKDFLYGALMIASEGAATPFLSTHTLDGLANPDFSANEGFFFTLFGENQITANSWKLKSCLVKSLRLKWSNADNGGRPVMSMTVVSGYKREDSTPTGTRVFNDDQIAPSFHDTPRTLVVNGLDLYPREFELSIENDISFDSPEGGNYTNAKLQGQMITCNVVAKYDTESDGLLYSKDDDVAACTFTIGAASAAPFFDFQSQHTLLNSVEKNNGAEGESPSLSMALEPRLDTANSQTIVIRTADDVDHSF